MAGSAETRPKSPNTIRPESLSPASAMVNR